MATKLKNLQLTEVSLVDRGANQHAHITLFKRDGEPVAKDMYGVGRFAEVISSIAYLTRSAQYEATEEGDNSLVPAKLRSWLQQGAVIFQQMAAEEINELVASASEIAKKDGAPLTAKLTKATKALAKSVKSIVADTEGDQTAALTETFKQYHDHLQALASATDQPIIKEDNMSEDIKKQLDDVTKKLADAEVAVAKVAKENAFLKLSDAHKTYIVEKKLSDEDKEIFVSKSEADRDAHMVANPVVKVVDTELAKRDAVIEDLRKRVEASEEAKIVGSFAKRAADLDLPEAKGEVLRKAYSGDVAAQTEIESLIKGLREQVKTGKVFEEFGTSKGADTTSPTAKVDAVVLDMQKADPKLTRSQAIAKIAADPKQRDLWNEYKSAKVAA